MSSDRYALAKRRYIASSSDDEPPAFKTPVDKKPQRVPRSHVEKPPRLDIDFSSDDDDLFRRRPVAKKQITSGRTGAAHPKPRRGGNSSSDSDLEFDYEAAVRNQQKEYVRKPKSERKTKEKGHHGDDCSSCSGPECEARKKKRHAKQSGGKLLARMTEQQQRALAHRDQVRSESGSKSSAGDKSSSYKSREGNREVVPLRKQYGGVKKSCVGQDGDSVESSDDALLGAARSCKLLERHIKRRESTRKEFRTISSNDEMVRRTWESLSPRTKPSRRAQMHWPPDNGAWEISGEAINLGGSKQRESSSKDIQRRALADGRGDSDEDSDDIDMASQPREYGRLRNERVPEQYANRPLISLHSRACPPIEEESENEEQLTQKSRSLDDSPKQIPKQYLRHRELVSRVHATVEQPSLIWDRSVYGSFPPGQSEPEPQSSQSALTKPRKENRVPQPGKYSANPPWELQRAGLNNSTPQEEDASLRRSRSLTPRPSRQEEVVQNAPPSRRRTSCENEPSRSMDSERFAHVAGAAVRVMEPMQHSQPEQDRSVPQGPQILGSTSVPKSADDERRRSESDRSQFLPTTDWRQTRMAIENSSSRATREDPPTSGDLQPFTTSPAEHGVPESMEITYRNSHMPQDRTNDSTKKQMMHAGSGDGAHATGNQAKVTNTGNWVSPGGGAERRDPEPSSTTTNLQGKQKWFLPDLDHLYPSQREGCLIPDTSNTADKKPTWIPLGSSSISQENESGTGFAPFTPNLPSTPAPDPRVETKNEVTTEDKTSPASGSSDSKSESILKEMVTEAMRIIRDQISAELRERDNRVEGILQGHRDTCVRLGEEMTDLRHDVTTERSRSKKEIQKIVEDAKPVKDQIQELKEQMRAVDLEPPDPSNPHSEMDKRNPFRNLSSRLTNIEENIFQEMQRLSAHTQQQIDICKSECRAGSTDVENNRILEIEHNINDIVDVIREGALPMNVSHLEDHLRRIDGEVMQNSKEVLNLRQEHEKNMERNKDQIRRVEEQSKLATSELRCKVDFLDTKLKATDNRVSSIEKTSTAIKNGLRDAELKIEDVEILVEQVAAACNATVKAVDQKHNRFKNALRSIKETAVVTNAKCDALAEAMAKLHKDTVANSGRWTGQGKSKTHEYFAHVTVQKQDTGVSTSAKHREFLVTDKGPASSSGARKVEVLPSPISRDAQPGKDNR